jgi:hypothetical protein
MTAKITIKKGTVLPNTGANKYSDEFKVSVIF